MLNRMNKRNAAYIAWQTSVAGIAICACLLTTGCWDAKETQDRNFVLIAAIDSSNQNSIKLHQSFGFTHVGTLKQVGFKFERWLDVELYQKILSTPAQANEIR